MKREYPCPTDCWKPYEGIERKLRAERRDVERIQAWCETMREAVKHMKEIRRKA